MNMKKLTVAAAVAAAVGATAPSHAMITGVPGEALLVPLMLEDTSNDGTGNTNTYVQLRIPVVLGQEAVMNPYTAPHVTIDQPGWGTGETGITQTSPESDWQIHWVAYNHRSGPIASGTCYGSPGDAILWSTDEDLRDEQEDQNNNVTVPGLGTPSSICGQGLSSRVGYVVFQTAAGGRGVNADFAFEGQAWITDNDIAENTVALMAVPVIPMPDGADPADPVGASVVLGENEVIVDVPHGTQAVNNPIEVSPVTAGSRNNNDDADQADPSHFSAMVQGPWNETYQGYSLHVFWFDRNDDGRYAYTRLWNEHEDKCDMEVPLPHEVNIWAWNMSVTAVPAITGTLPADRWDTVDNATSENLRITDVVGSTTFTLLTGFNSPEYCYTSGWDQTIEGYAEYILRTTGGVAYEPVYGGEGASTASGVFFSYEEDTYNSDAWGGPHAMSDRGNL
jgi:hypothetical protein